MKNVPILKIVPKAASNFPGFPSLSLVIFSGVHSWPAFRKIFRITGGFRKPSHRGYKKAEKSSLLLEEFLQLVNDFIEASINFTIDFFFTKRQPKTVTPSALIQKALFDFWDLNKKIFIP